MDTLQTMNYERENAQKKFDSARSNLFLMIALTLVNMVLLVLQQLFYWYIYYAGCLVKNIMAG